MLQQYFENLQAGIEAKLRKDPQSDTPRKRYVLEIARLGKRLSSGDHRIAWCGIAAPFDLLTAMGIASGFVEFVGSILASTGTVGAFLEEAQFNGYAADSCAYHRSVIGAALKGLVPAPDFFIATTCPCSGGLAVVETLARIFKKDLFILHVPQEASPENISYLADQIRAMTQFVTRHTGEPLDKQRLREAIRRTNRARELLIETYRLARHVPSPADGRELGNLGIVLPLLLGTEAAVEIARAYRDAFAARIKEGISGVPGERLRLMWIQNRIQFKHPLVQLLETQYQAVIIPDELNDITWEAIDPDDPYPGLAQRAISIPLNGPIRERIRHMKKLARDYQVDGAIHPCHWGCRQGTGARGLIAAGLKEIGVPVLNLEVDCVDSRNYAEGQIKTRLEAFIEMLTRRPSPRQ